MSKVTQVRVLSPRRQSQEKTLRLRASVATGTLLAAGLSAGSLFLLASPASASTEDPQFVTLCHATGSSKNPYVVITVDVAGAVNGHYKQHDDDQPGDDIIPSFTYQGEVYSLNWTEAETWGIPEDAQVRTADARKWLQEHGCLPGDDETPPAQDTPVAPSSTGGPPAQDTPARPSAGGPPAEGTPATPPHEAPVVPVVPAPASPAPSGTEDIAEGDHGTADSGTVDEITADEQSETSVVPAGAVPAGDGSAAAEGSSALPYVLGGVALTAAGGAAFAARRSSRASA